MNYREEFLKDPKYANLPDWERERMAACICPGCGTMASQFHKVDCFELEKIVEEGGSIDLLEKEAQNE